MLRLPKAARVLPNQEQHRPGGLEQREARPGQSTMTLRRTLEDIRARISRYRGSRKLNEQNTKATLIEPVLRALGWDLEDLEEVRREYKLKRRDRPVDCALLLVRTPRLLVEAKALRRPSRASAYGPRG